MSVDLKYMKKKTKTKYDSDFHDRTNFMNYDFNHYSTGDVSKTTIVIVILGAIVFYGLIFYHLS